MYIYIFEDGEVRKCAKFEQLDMESCDDGILDVIDLSQEEPKQYHAGGWHDLPSAD